MNTDPSARNSDSSNLGGIQDADLAAELPAPEPRHKRGSAHMDRKELRQLWYKGIPKLDDARKKRNRLIPQDEFQYEKLEKGHIRLLSLNPHKFGEPSSPLYARVFTRRLDEVRGRYEALSYTWGDQSVRPKEVINIRNANPLLPTPEKFTAQMIAAAAMRLKFHRFPIYENLHSALMQLRGGLKPVIIWIDAICIDQSEKGEEEKRQQLMIMDDIYKSAANVCVWIGGGFRGSTEGMQLAREITNFQTFDRPMASVTAERRWPEVIKLLKSSWFGRRWTIQEIALAREATMHCGPDVIHWDDFAETMTLLLDHIGVLRKSFRDEIFEDVETTSGFVLLTMLNTVCRKSDRGEVLSKLCDLETLVSTLLGFQATHPKDAIFSVLSLARDPPQPDEAWEQKLHGKQLARLDRAAAAASATGNANSSMFFKYQLSTRDVFIAFVTRSIFNSGSLDIVCRHWAPPVVDRYGKEVAMPSWVSPLARSPYGLAGTFMGRQNSDNLVAYSPYDRRKQYSAAGSSSAVIEMVDDQSPKFQIDHPLAIASFLMVANPDGGIVQSPGAISSSSPSFGLSGPTLLGPPQSITLSAESPAHPEQAAVATGDTVDADKMSRLPTPGNLPEPSAGVNNNKLPQLQFHVPKIARVPSASSSGRPRRGSLLRQATSKAVDVERAQHLSGILAARGFVVGHIREVSDVMRGGIVPGRWMQELGWGDGVDDSNSKNNDSNRVPELLWRTLVADRNSRGGHPPPWYRRACLHALHDPRKTDIEGSLHTVTPRDRDISEHSTRYLRRVQSVVWNRRLFRIDLATRNVGPDVNGDGAAGTISTGLKDPLYGIGPSGTACGDRVCILLGCSVPVILGEGKRRGVSRIVGEAYVHGIMDGEAMYLNDTRSDRFTLE